MGVGDFNEYGCDLFCKVTNTKNNTLILLAKTGIVFFDLAKNKITPTPGAFSSLFL
jgi:acyl-CoA thioesterase FadM